MKLRMKTDVSGARNGQEWPPRGKTLDSDKFGLSEAEVQRYVRAGIVEPVGKDAEAAVPDSSDVETATVDTRPKRRGRPPKSQAGLTKATVEGDGE